MTSLKRLNSNRIYFFDKTENDEYTNTLKEFMYFLKSKGVHENIDFCYANSKDSLHCHLSIKDNFILDAIPTSLIKESEINLNEFIDKLSNKHLKQLIVKLGDLNTPINKLDLSKIKLVSIIKVILSQSKYIFLNKPDESTSNDDLEQIKKCINFEVKQNSRIVMLKSKRKLLWPDIITNIITKNDQHGFNDATNPLLKNGQSENKSHTYSFTLNKKVS